MLFPSFHHPHPPPLSLLFSAGQKAGGSLDPDAAGITRQQLAALKRRERELEDRATSLEEQLSAERASKQTETVRLGSQLSRLRIKAHDTEERLAGRIKELEATAKGGTTRGVRAWVGFTFCSHAGR